MTTQARIGTALFAIALAGCARVNGESLPQPQAVMVEGELCTRITLVDGDDAVWYDRGGCEGDAVDLEHVGNLTADERAELDAQVDGILSMTPAACELGETEVYFRAGERDGRYCTVVPEVQLLAQRFRFYRERGL